MEIIDRKLVEEAAIKLSHSEVPFIKGQYSNGLITGIEFGFEKGIDFTEEQLKQKMIEFVIYCDDNYIEDCVNFQQLLEEFLKK